MRKLTALKILALAVFVLMVGFSFIGCQPANSASAPAEVQQETSQSDEPESEEQTEATDAAEAAGETKIQEGFMPGKKAYDFELVDLNGQKAKLSDYLGKVVVLNFFASWCPPCQVEMPHINEVYKELKDKDVVILGINLTEQDNMDDLKALLEENQIEFPILLDENSEVAGLYGIRSIPVNVVVTAEGIVSEYSIGAIDEARLKGFIEDAQAK